MLTTVFLSAWIAFLQAQLAMVRLLIRLSGHRERLRRSAG
jgi:hypothetical protein